MKRILLFAFTAMLVGIAPSAAQAGFTVQTGLSSVVNTDVGGPGGTIGDSFSIGGSILGADSAPGGMFAAYVPDSPFDPQITGGDLNLFRFNLTGTIVSLASNVVSYDGDYLLFYDQDGNGEPNEGLQISLGDFSGTAAFDIITGETATFAGTLMQTQGPNNPAFADLSYGGSDIVLTGAYIDSTLGDGPSATGTLTATLRQNAVAIPEPATFGIAALAFAAIAARSVRR